MTGRNVFLLFAVVAALATGLWAITGSPAPAADPPRDEAELAEPPPVDRQEPAAPQAFMAVGATRLPQLKLDAPSAIQPAFVPAEPPEIEVPRPPAVAFQAAPRESDFRTPALPGHDAEAMRQVSDQFTRWTQLPENKDADARYLGIDCRQPPCLMSVQFNADHDATFLQRSGTWMTEKAGVGPVVAYPHLIGRDEQRIWYFANPHPPATREHHEFEQGAIARIQAEVATLPTYNPSAKPM